MTRRLLLIPVAVFLLAFSACGGGAGSLINVEGTASYDGKAIEEGDIQFIPADTKYGAEGGKIINGSFTAKARVGKNKVAIRASRKTGKQGPMGPGDEERESYIPDKYNDKTTLEEEVSSSKKKFEFKLTK